MAGRCPSSTACKSSPAGFACKCLSRIVVHTYSKESMLSWRCLGVSASASEAARRTPPATMAALRLMSRILFLGELIQIIAFRAIDRLAIALRIDKRIRLFTNLQERPLFVHAVVGAMRAEDHVARQRSQDLPGACRIIRDRRVLGIVQQAHAGIDGSAGDDNDIQFPATLLNGRGPGGTAFGVAGSKMGVQHRFAVSHRVAVVKHAIDFAGLPGNLTVPSEVALAAICDDVIVSLHAKNSCAGKCFAPQS